jgi:hypothetical protein
LEYALLDSTNSLFLQKVVNILSQAISSQVSARAQILLCANGL